MVNIGGCVPRALSWCWLHPWHVKKYYESSDDNVQSDVNCFCGVTLHAVILSTRLNSLVNARSGLCSITVDGLKKCRALVRHTSATHFSVTMYRPDDKGTAFAEYTNGLRKVSVIFLSRIRMIVLTRLLREQHPRVTFDWSWCEWKTTQYCEFPRSWGHELGRKSTVVTAFYHFVV